MTLTRSLSALLRRPAVGLKSLLISLPLLAALPLLVYSAWLLFLMAERSREATLGELEAADQALATVVERELMQATKVLELLADSPALRAGRVDREQFDSSVRNVLESGWGIRTVAVFDRLGGHVLAVPEVGDPRTPRQLQPHQEQALSTGQPVISDLYHGPFDTGLAPAITLPVVRDGKVQWVLSAWMDPTHLGRLLAQQVGHHQDAVGTILDAERNILARSVDMDRFFGLQPSSATLVALQSGPSGTQRFPTRDGRELLWAWTTLPWGWTVMFGTPAQSMDAALRASMLRLAAAGLVALALSVGIAAWVARRIARSVDTMSENVPRLAQGEVPTCEPSGVRQLDALYLALQTASQRLGSALNERARALEAERAARAAADEDNRAKDVFLATLAHELRNPLAPIRTAARLLREPQADASSRRWAAEVIDRQVGAMALLLDDLLDISRITSGRIALDRRRVGLSSVLEAAVEVARPLIDSRGHALVLSLPRGEVVLDGDPLRLSQVFSNLLTNAAKYTDPSGRIEVGASVEGGEVLVRVRDNGIGIEPQALGRLFQMFSQVKSPLDRSEGGLGIGLALVRGLVELHGGRVEASSEGPGRGSEFRVALPLAGAPPAVPEPDEAGGAAGTAGTQARPARALRVLIADDNEDAAGSLEMLLRLQGHETRVAHGGEAALRLAESFRPDVACLDIGMPDLNGYEVARRLRALPWGREIRLAALTGWGAEDDRQRARAAGFDIHLTKPVDPGALTRWVEERATC